VAIDGNTSAVSASPPPVANPPDDALTGRVMSDEATTARIGVPVDGQVIAVRAIVAQFVHANDVLAVIHPAETSGRPGAARARDREIRARRDGVVMEANVGVGSEVVRDPSRAMFVTTDLSNVDVEATFPEVRMPLMWVGARAAVQLTAFPNRIFEGVVTRVFPTLDRQTHRGTLTVHLANPDHSMQPGMSATVRLAGPTP
jgi:multidrug efflux pump subunit AcrA (membrane-fusion protein)